MKTTTEIACKLHIKRLSAFRKTSIFFFDGFHPFFRQFEIGVQVGEGHVTIVGGSLN